MKRMLFVALAVTCMAFSARAAFWHTDFGEAQRKAYGENRTLLVYFTCSDNGGTCERLQQEVFASYEFQTFADRHLILVQVDFPRWKQLHPTQLKINRDLADKYNAQGYPIVVVANNRGQALGRMGFMEGGPDPYIKAIERAAGLMGKAGAADAPDPDAPPLWNGAPVRPAPQYKDLTLKSISGTGDKRLALINNATLGVGESGKVRLGTGEVKVRVDAIRARSVIVTVDGKKGQRELNLLPPAPQPTGKEPQQAKAKK